MGGYEQWLLDQLIAGRSPTNNGIHPRRFSLANSMYSRMIILRKTGVWRFELEFEGLNFEFGVCSLEIEV